MNSLEVRMDSFGFLRGLIELWEESDLLWTKVTVVSTISSLTDRLREKRLLSLGREQRHMSLHSFVGSLPSKVSTRDSMTQNIVNRSIGHNLFWCPKRMLSVSSRNLDRKS